MKGEAYEPNLAVVIGFSTIGAGLFAAVGASAFVPGIAGVLAASLAAFGVSLLAAVARRTKPSRTWAIVAAGLILGAAAGVVLVREFSLHRHHWNQWALFTIPIAAICGNALGSSRWAASIIGSLLPRR